MPTHPVKSNFRRRLARQYVAAGDLMHKAGRPADAEKAYQSAIETWEQLLEAFPDVLIDHRELAQIFSANSRQPFAQFGASDGVGDAGS